MRTILRYGQIGGTLNAFIGDVHRKAISIDGQAELVAGCFSTRNPEANGRALRYRSRKDIPQLQGDGRS